MESWMPSGEGRPRRWAFLAILVAAIEALIKKESSGYAQEAAQEYEADENRKI